jgi:hypothetical protein
MKKIWIVVATLIIFTTPSFAICQTSNNLIGTWKLLSVVSKTDKGDINKEEYGKNPTGYLTFTPEGRMMAIITLDGRKKLSADSFSAPAEERAQAFATLIAYGGSYVFTGDNLVTQVDIAANPNWVGGKQERFVRFDGDKVILRTPPMPRGGVLRTVELTWERVR